MTASEALERMREDAFEQAQELSDADCVPVIISRVGTIVDRHQRASMWTAQADYGVGDVVQLYPSTGHRYVCITAGTSGAMFPPSYTYYGYGVTDGTVYWQDCGAAYVNVYDIRAIVEECWMHKAAKASLLIDQAGISASQLQAQCRARAREFARAGVA